VVTLLIDGNNLAIRSYLAPKNDMSVEGIDTGTLVLFAATLSRYVRLERPTHGLVAWDSGASAYRTRLFPAYKANRKQKATDQSQAPFAVIYKFLKLAGFPQLQLPGYEGDDIIGASWRACRGREQIRILSSDKDMLQLVEDGTEQLKLINNGAKPDRWDRTRFIRDMGYKPEHQAWILALTGDSSDGIPGLTKVGPKTAIKMLDKVDWNIVDLVESLNQEDQERVLLNLALVDLSYVPLELRAPPALNLVSKGDTGFDELIDYCDRFKLERIKRQLEDDSLWH
jgi:DNA polymerase-1